MKCSVALERLGGLVGVKKASLLCRLALNCSIAARGAYIEADCSPDDAARQLRGYNEILLVVNSELDAALNEPSRARTPQEFVSTIEHWIAIAKISTGMDYACKRAFPDGTDLESVD